MLPIGTDHHLRLATELAASTARVVAATLDAGAGRLARTSETDWSSPAEDGCAAVLFGLEDRARAVAVDLRRAAATLTLAAAAP